MRIILILILTLFFVNSAAAEEYKHYDNDYKLTGHTVVDNNKETHYDGNYRLIGRTIDGVRYDESYKRIGTIDKNGTIYDKNFRIIGYEKKEGNRTVIYDNCFRIKGYKKN